MPLAIESGDFTWAGLVGGVIAAGVGACIGGFVTLFALYLTLRGAQRSRDSERLIEAVATARTTTLNFTRLMHRGEDLQAVRVARSATDGELLLVIALARRARDDRLNEVCKVLRDRLADESRAIVRDPEAVPLAARDAAVMTGRTTAKVLHEWLQGSFDPRHGSGAELVARTSSELATEPWSASRPGQSTVSRPLARLWPYRLAKRMSSALRRT